MCCLERAEINPPSLPSRFSSSCLILRRIHDVCHAVGMYLAYPWRHGYERPAHVEFLNEQKEREVQRTYTRGL